MALGDPPSLPNPIGSGKSSDRGPATARRDYYPGAAPAVTVTAGSVEVRASEAAVAASCMSLPKSSPSESVSSAPSLPEEWLIGARAMQANRARASSSSPRCGGGAAAAAAASATAVAARRLSSDDARYGGSVENTLGYDVGGAGTIPAAGGEAARGVGAEMDGASGHGGGAAGATAAAGGGDVGGGSGDRAIKLAGEEGGDSGMASPPSTGSRSGVQSPGGGPSRSMATAGLPAEGGGGGFRESAWQERQRTTTAVDRWEG